MNEGFAYTVRCFDDKQLTRHCVSIEEATAYANELLGEKHRCRIYPYQRRRYVDVVVERAKREGMPR